MCRPIREVAPPLLLPLLLLLLPLPLLPLPLPRASPRELPRELVTPLPYGSAAHEQLTSRTVTY